MQHGGTNPSRMLRHTQTHTQSFTHLTVYNIWRGGSAGDFEYSAALLSYLYFPWSISESNQNVNPLALTSTQRIAAYLDAEIRPGGFQGGDIVLKLMLVLTTSTACFVQISVSQSDAACFFNLVCHVLRII